MLGIFDSGVGGITVVKELLKINPQLSFVYLGDNARTPYGSRGQEIIQKYSQEDVDFLIKQGVTTIIIACNTASAWAGDFLKSKYDLPIFEVISPAVEKAVKIARGRVGVIGTRGTINSGVYQCLLADSNLDLKIFSVACPLFVPLVEENFVKRKEVKSIARAYLQPLKNSQIDSLILGCTHYPMLKSIIASKLGKRVKLIDPAEEIAQKISEFIANNSELSATKNVRKYYATDTSSRFRELAERWLGEKIDLQKAEL